MTTEIKVNDSVFTEDGEEHEVVSIKRGWYELDDGTKHRAKDLELATDSDEFADYVDGEEGGEDEEEQGSRMSRQLRKYAPTYRTTTNYAGRSSKDTGDEVAQSLEGLSPAQVMSVANQTIEHYDSTKYMKLNPGQRRMIAGNMIRNAVKKGELSKTALKKAIKSAK